MDGINKFLETDFTEEQMEVIYTYLGNSIHHSRTIEFIENGYDSFYTYIHYIVGKKHYLTNGKYIWGNYRTKKISPHYVSLFFFITDFQFFLSHL